VTKVIFLDSYFFWGASVFEKVLEKVHHIRGYSSKNNKTLDNNEGALL
jgi:hypothetical protein